MYSCDACEKRTHCRRICPEIEKLLPPHDGGTDFELNSIDRSVAWRVQEIEDDLTPRQRQVARMYHRFGLSQELIAGKLGICHQRVSRILLKIRKKIRQGGSKLPI